MMESEGMLKVSFSEFAARLDEFLEQARTVPVSLVDDDKETLVIVSAEEYARLKRRDRQVWRTEEVPETYINQIRQAGLEEAIAEGDADVAAGRFSTYQSGELSAEVSEALGDEQTRSQKPGDNQ